VHETADIVVIGAGIIGMSAAFQLARRSSLRIIVLDRGVGPGEGSTGASSAVCRFRYSHAEIVRLAMDGIGAYQSWPEFLKNAAPMARYHRIGALWLSGDPDWTSHEASRLGGLGVRVDTLDDRAMRERYPAIGTCPLSPDLVAGEPHACTGGGLHLLERDGGYIDPVDALQDLIAAARALGVEVRFGAPVADIEVRNGRAVGVLLADGASIACGTIVEAAGPWCTPFLKRHGLDRWPLEPTRIQIVHIDRPPAMEGELPVCIDLPGGIYFRPQNRGQQVILGSLLEEDEQERVNDPDAFSTYADDDFIRARLHALQHRLNVAALTGRVRGYSGLYTINRSVMHPIVGPAPIPGLYLANGFSGHGFKLAPAIGGLLAREITGRSDAFDTGMPAGFLAYERDPISLSAMTVLA
jgi:glycine/D-amino acid oxidase-like deaminating enzyme